ncbi:MAG: type IV secretory system conjugative DNA transfer family protein [Solirubrobacteraceae bacterium]
MRSTLTGVIPSLRITDESASPDEAVTLAARLFIPTPCVLSADNPVAASRMLLSGMVGLRGGEQLILRLGLRPGNARTWREPESPSERERETAKKWRSKTGAPGFTTSGLMLIRSPKMSRARELASHIENTLRGRRQVGGVRVMRERGNRTLAAQPRTTRTSGWLSTPELLALTGWPLGPDVVPGVAVGAARELLVPRSGPTSGRRLFMGRDAGGERPVALSADGARHHMAVVGPAGVGKSVLLANCVLSNIEQGFAGLVIDPKSDLLDEILNRVKPEYAERIVVLDPGDDSRSVPGIDVLHGGDLDARADVLTRTLKSMFPDWGIRSEIWGRLAIRTLSEVPGATLLDIGRLFADEPYRRAAVARLRDDYLISSWQNYEALSPAAKVDVVQAPLARVMALLSRPKVRAVLASPEPKLDLARLFAEKKFLLVSLAPGVLGEAAPLIASAVVFAAWSSIEARVALPPEKRHLINLYVDELATLVNGLPNSFELIAERARGLGASLTVALQTLARIPEPTKSALLGNAATFVTFRAPAEEATAIARQLPGLTPQDVQALGRFEVAARIGTGVGSAVSVVTGRTEPLPPATGQAGAIRDRSAALYGATSQPPAPGQSIETTSDETPLGRAGRAL